MKSEQARTLDDVRHRVSLVKHAGAVLQTCVDDRAWLLGELDTALEENAKLRDWKGRTDLVGPELIAERNAAEDRARELEACLDTVTAKLGVIIAEVLKFIEGGPRGRLAR